jgi:hypothetical protein
VTIVRAVGLAGALVVSAFVAFGIWLLATPDYDGGRRAVGGMIVGVAGVILAYAVVFAVVRSKRTR